MAVIRRSRAVLEQGYLRKGERDNVPIRNCTILDDRVCDGEADEGIHLRHRSNLSSAVAESQFSGLLDEILPYMMSTYGVY